MNLLLRYPVNTLPIDTHSPGILGVFHKSTIERSRSVGARGAFRLGLEHLRRRCLHSCRCFVDGSFMQNNMLNAEEVFQSKRFCFQ